MSTRVQFASRQILQNVFFLNSIVSSGTYGAVLSKNQLSIVDASGNSAFPFASVNFQGMQLPAGWKTNTAETVGVVKPTEPALALASEYGFTIRQFNPYLGPGGSWATHPIYASTPPTGTTPSAGYIATAWKAQIAVFKDLHIASMTIAGGVLTITAAAGYPEIIVDTPINGVTFTAGTSPVVGLGNNADMTAFNGLTGQPFSSYTGYVATNAYDRVVINWQTTDGSQYQTILFVNTGDANYANFVTSLNTDIFKAGGLAFVEAAVQVNA